jgi:hypothetical protein
MIRIASLTGLVLATLTGVSAKWTASIQSKDGGKLSGTATLERSESEPMTPPAKDSMVRDSTNRTRDTSYRAPAKETTKASVSIKGGEPNASYSWHVHSGTCASMGAVLGAMSNYPSLKVGSDGSAMADAKISAPVGTGSYALGIHKGTETETVACGDFRPGVTP